MSTEIKNTLFRFVTMRSPELSEETNKDKRFVYRAAGVNGVFDTAVANRGNKTKWQAMKGVSFTPATEAAIKGSVREELYDFAIWIARNKYSFSDADLLNQIPAEYREFTIEEQLLWNNLFYQVITQKDFYVKELIMQLLVAYHVCRNFDENKKELRKLLMSAKVVLPKELFVDDAPSNGSTMSIMAREEGIADEEPQMTLPSEEMLRSQTISLSAINIERYKKLKKELKKVEEAYNKEYELMHDRAQQGYLAQVKPILEAHSKDVEESKTRWCSVRDPKAVYDPADPCNQPPAVMPPVLPEFEFQFREEIDLSYLQETLTKPAFETLLEVLEISREESVSEKDAKAESRIAPSASRFSNYIGDASFKKVFTQIETGIDDNTQIIVGNTPSQGNTAVSIGGVIIPTTTAVSAMLPTLYQACPKVYTSNANGGTYVNVDLTFGVADSSWQVLGVETTVENNSGVKVVRNTFTQNRTGNTVRLTNLHHDALTTGDFYYSMKSFTVLVTFTNGAKKSLKTNFWNTLNCASGNLKTVLEPIQTVPTTPTIPSVPATGADGTFVPKGYGVKQLGIADYKKVEQTVQGYVEGEVAAIENIMAREYKEKSTRRLRRSENTTTVSSESEREQLSDTTNTTRFDMQTEVTKVLKESKDFSAGATFGASWGTEATGKITLGTNVNMATHSSKEENTRQAVTQAKEVTERAMERIVTKVKQERIEKIIEEFEENNKHGFDNTSGDKHVVGVYRWVDKVFKNQIYNYGKRLMFEFMIPEPAKLHVLGMTENTVTATSKKLEVPDDPRTFVDPTGAVVKFNMKDYTLIDEARVKYWGSKFNVELKPMKELVAYTGKSISGEHAGSISSVEFFSMKDEIKVPEGYKAVSATVSMNALDDNDQRNGKGVLISVGDTVFSNLTKYSLVNTSVSKSIANFLDTVPVSATFANYFSGSASIAVRCELTNEAKVKWQQETFKAIIDAYEDAKAEYEQQLTEENDKGSVIKESNPGFYRQIENLILRKNCISYIIDQNVNAVRTYGKDMSKSLNLGTVRSFGNHEISVDARLDDYAAFVKFMEQAFEWDIMSYNFYPYYWGSRESWPALYQYENNDPLFRSFMQAGMARVIVTVRPGFEDAVRYYMQTGQIWNGGEVPVIEDKLFMSIVDELSKPEGQKEGKAWATRLPTALTILQADSIGLKVDKALPYDEDLSDYEDPTSVPHSPNFHITGAQLNNGATKTLTFSYEDMDSYGVESIGYYDSHSGFPRTFRCMGEEIVIQRDAAWQPTDSPEVIYKKLANELSLITGIEAQQYTSPNGNASSIRFIVDTSVASTFIFEKETPTTPVKPAFDLIKINFNADSVKFTNPTFYVDKLLDANGTKLTSAEINTLLPISRFSI